eukprot:181640_1
MDPFKGDTLLSKLGEFYEKQQEERKQKRRRRNCKKKKHKKKVKSSSITPIVKGEEFCYKLGTVKIHIENEHLDGIKPEDLSSISYISKNCIKKISDTQYTYYLPVVLEYFKIVTDIPNNKRRRKKKRKSLPPLEGFKLYYVNDMDKIYIG